jgi:hypothetical protein
MAIEQTDDQRPSGYTTDGVPWEEPRGPHLPDVLTRQPVLVWPFLALAALIAAQTVAEVANDASLTADIAIRSVLSAIPPIATALLGAAWFRRQPDPTLRSAMAIGVTLLALNTAMRLASSWLLASADSIFATPDDPFRTGGLNGIWSSIEGTVFILASVCLLRAFAVARRQPDAPSQRAVTMGVAALAVAAIGAQLWFTLTSVDATGDTLFASNVSATLLSVVALVTSVVVTAQLVAGARAGEAPLIAWRLGALGFFLPWLTSLLGWLVVAVRPSFQDFFVPYVWSVETIGALAALAFLGAVALGLASVESTSVDLLDPATDAST